MRLRRMADSQSGDWRARGPDGRKERRQERLRYLRYQMRVAAMLDGQSGDRRAWGLVVHEFHVAARAACKCYGKC
jgi:hypothetical protein